MTSAAPHAPPLSPPAAPMAGVVAPEERKKLRREMSCLGKAIASAIEGGLIGGALGGIMASGSALSLGLSVQALVLVGRSSFSSAASFGGFLAFYNGGSCSMERLRGVRDWINPFIVGGVIGLAGVQERHVQSVRIEAIFGHAHVALYPLDTLPTCSRHTSPLVLGTLPTLFSPHLYARFSQARCRASSRRCPRRRGHTGTHAPWRAQARTRPLSDVAPNAHTFRCWPKKAHTFRVDPKISQFPTRPQNLHNFGFSSNVSHFATTSDASSHVCHSCHHPHFVSLSQLSPREPSVNKF